MSIKKLNLDSKYNILVTGGAGFIGSNLCKALLANGNKVRILDNLVTGHLKNIAAIREHVNLEFIEGDIRNLQACETACSNMHYVLHHAALGSVPRSINDPITTNDINVTGFLNMLVASKNAGIKRIIYAASSSTYGDSKILPKEEDIIGKPLSPYAITKYVNELYAHVFSKEYGIEIIGLRYFNVFGRFQDPNGAYAAVIPKFVMHCINNEPATIYGDGTFSRDFTHIDNVIEANIRAMTTTNTQALNTVYNVAYGQRTSLNELANLIKKYLAELNPNIEFQQVKYCEERSGDVPHSHASIKKAKTLLGYSPQVDVKRGLQETVQWYWKHLNTSASALSN
jgi:UDP-N-acetylglucosamine 4-epimerase